VVVIDQGNAIQGFMFSGGKVPKEVLAMIKHGFLDLFPVAGAKARVFTLATE
jgi:hypothetical protein